MRGSHVCRKCSSQTQTTDGTHVQGLQSSERKLFPNNHTICFISPSFCFHSLSTSYNTVPGGAHNNSHLKMTQMP